MMHLDMNGIIVDTYENAYHISQRTQGDITVNLKELLSLVLLLECVLASIKLETGGKSVHLISHPDGKEEIVLA